MARRKSFMSTVSKMARDAERARNARERRETQIAKEAERTQKAYFRALEQQSKADAKAQKEQEKEEKRLYLESRVAQVALQNEHLEQQIDDLNNILKDTLSVDDYLDFETLKKKKPSNQPFALSRLGQRDTKPTLESLLPPKPTGLQKLIPGTMKKYEQAVAVAHKEFNKLMDLWKEIETHNAEIAQFQKEFDAGEPEAIINYFTLVLEASSYPEGFPQNAKIAYVPESKQLVVEYDLPSFEIIPEVAEYKYAKTKDEITTTARPLTQRKNLYASVTAQIALRTIHELFEADRTKHIDTIVFNGYVDTIDKGTGRSVRVCLVTLRTTRDVFSELDLSKVEPLACLKTLNASVSKSPAELAPVRPVLEFSMVDPRFVQETDVLSTLDQRPNLMALTPSEFESLITNLFEKMGLETRLTQASRDGGVDCVAYDPRPIFGGKVVIQAKRYKHTVGVSAVRDLFGTLQNEGASKGILVTTSGFGKSAFEFAEGKPIELLSGSHLLYLLNEHAGVDAKIEPPDNWKDPILDSAEFEE